MQKKRVTTTRDKVIRSAEIVLACVFWIIVWHGAAEITDMELLLPTPERTAQRLFELMGTEAFFRNVFTSLGNIALGFVTGALAGTALGILTALSEHFNRLTLPVGKIIKTTPVASFIILALVWIKADNVPSFVSFLMVTPIVWDSLRTAIRSADTDLLEAAAAYRLGFCGTLKAVYIPSCINIYMTSLRTSMSLAWKAGIAAEVLCTPKHSIGTSLYESKVYMETADLFAWTLTVIVISVILEMLITKGFGLIMKKRSGTNG